MGIISFNQLCKNWGIAITGGIATGKSTTCDWLQKQGYDVFDADKLAQKVRSEHTKQIASLFNLPVIKNNGMLDTTVIKEAICRNPKTRHRLEQFMHPLIATKLKNELTITQLDKNPRLWFYEASLIIESGLAHNFRELWITTCDYDTQVTRLENRDHINTTQAKKLVSLQLDYQHKKHLANLIIDTEKNTDTTYKNITNRLKEISRHIQNKKIV